MGKKKYVVESTFDDLHGNPDDTSELDVDLTDADNPIITAALEESEEDENWKPPIDDDENEGEEKDGEEEEDDGDKDDTDDDSELEELDDDGDDDEDSGEEEEDDDDDDDGAEDDEQYSKNVQKRIDRERSLRRQDKEDSDRRIAKLERKAELRDKQDEFRGEQAEADKKLAALKKKKTEALEEGETAQVVEIDDEILDIKADRKAKQIQLKQTEDAIDNDTSDDRSSSTPEVGRKFLEKYPEFHTNHQFRNVMLLTDKSVAARGLDKNTQKYYDEIEKAMKPQFPSIIKISKITVKPKKKGKKKRSAVGSTQKPGTRRSKQSQRRGRIRLTKADQENMEIFGMDPTNPADAKAWAEGKES